MNFFELFLSAHFLFREILSLNQMFALHVKLKLYCKFPAQLAGIGLVRLFCDLKSRFLLRLINVPRSRGKKNLNLLEVPPKNLSGPEVTQWKIKLFGWSTKTWHTVGTTWCLPLPSPWASLFRAANAFGSRGPSEVSRPFASVTSLNCIDVQGLGKAAD